MEVKKLHNGHRQRFKERFRQTGIESFADHEVIEMLLYFGIPYKNTNDLAHVLLNKFGGISDVLDADYEELVNVSGIGDHTALLIVFMRELFRRYSKDKLSQKRVYKDADSIAEYAITHYIGVTSEHVELFLFDAAGHMIDHVTLCEGSLSSCSVNPELLGKYIYAARAASFVICHNHPSGMLVPSDEDLIVTREIYRAFSALNKHMMGHLLICGGQYVDILDKAIAFYD